MRYGVLLLGDRVAPRTIAADSLLLFALQHNRILTREMVSVVVDSWADLYEQLSRFNVNTLVCGGIANETKMILQSKDLDIIDNVAGTAEEIIAAAQAGKLGPEFGFKSSLQQNDLQGDGKASLIATDSAPGAAAVAPAVAPEATDSAPEASPQTTEQPGREADPALIELDCLSCEDRLCLWGKSCPLSERADCGKLLETADQKTIGRGGPEDFHTFQAMLDAAMDISTELERTLCRVSELVYFCLEMEYHRIGLAFCMDLLEPARILATLLGRFFEVHAVGCKIGGNPIEDPFSLTEAATRSGAVVHIARDLTDQTGALTRIACNPVGQAKALNSMGTDLNVVIGLCIGHDCIFNQMSQAPVTTLFVKDKSLANNPIGAIYSDYYLREVSKTPAFRQ